MNQDQNEYVYTPSSTDITLRWRQLYNYVPASEQPTYQKKWRDWKVFLSRSLEEQYNQPAPIFTIKRYK